MPLARFLAVLVAVTGSAVSAQPVPDLATDRPDFTESAVVVPLGSVQIEAGLTVTDRNAPPLHPDATHGLALTTLSGPEALVRWGFARGIEARIALPDYVVTGIERGGSGAFADPALGLKAELATLGGWDVATIAEVSLPLGDPELQTAANPFVLLIAGRDVAAFSVGTQAEVLWDRDLDRVDVGGTLVVGRGLGARVGAFLETTVGSSADGTAALVHHGYTLLLSPTVQLDARIGLGLTEAVPDRFGGLGASVRL